MRATTSPLMALLMTISICPKYRVNDDKDGVEKFQQDLHVETYYFVRLASWKTLHKKVLTPIRGGVNHTIFSGRADMTGMSI